MKLSALASQYVAYKQGMGMRFNTEARTLRSFCRIMGDIAMAEITADRVHDYIACLCPCRRFACRLAATHARLEVRMVRYSFPVGLFHSLFHAGLSPRTRRSSAAPHFSAPCRSASP